MIRIIILIVFLAEAAFERLLDILNMRAVEYSPVRPPREFKGLIDRKHLERSRDYFLERARLALGRALFTDAALLVFIFTGLLGAYNRWINSLGLSFVAGGVVFFVIIHAVFFILALTWSFYGTFGIEKKYGFSTATPALWAMDALKSLIISTAILCLVLLAAFYIIEKSPDLWWLWIWFFIIIFGAVMVYLSPYLIEPLFNRFTPLDEGELARAVREIARKAGVEVERVFRMDASRRTRHTNAYFTGLGRAKRIVLYDTLLKGLDVREIVSIVAHEAGHWKKKHVLKQLVLAALFGLLALYISFRLVEGGVLSRIFNIGGPAVYADLFLSAFILSLTALPARVFFNFISRWREREADLFAVETTGDRKAMISALVKLSVDNLSILHPHRLYVFFNYSHPPVLERIRYLRQA